MSQLRLSEGFAIILLAGLVLQIPNTSALPWEPEGRTDDEYWVGRHETFVNTTKSFVSTNASPRVVFYGDSITQDWAGYGSWVWDWKYKDLPSVNYAIGSERCQNILWRIMNEEMDGIEPELVVLKIGTNNLEGDTSDDIVRGIRTIVETLRSQHPSTKVLVLGILPRSNSWPEIWPKIADVNIKISRLDDGNMVRFLDMWHHFAQGWTQVVPELYTEDMLHLVTPGYETWTSVMDNLFNEMLGSKLTSCQF